MLRVSIIINTLNRATYLEQVLHALQYLDYPSFEVIVVNGPSEDHTEEVLKAHASLIKVGRCPEKNLAMSRNIGLAIAAGDIVAFTDDDAIPEPEWLSDIVRGYRDPNVAAVGGFVYDASGYQFQAQYQLLDRFGDSKPVDFNPSYTHSFPGSDKCPSLRGVNSSFRRELLLSLGGFDEQYDYFLEEADVCMRLVDAGYIVKLVSNAFVHHLTAPSQLRRMGPRAFVITNYYSIIKNLIYFIDKHNSDGPAENGFIFFDKIYKHARLIRWRINHLYNRQVISNSEREYALSTLYDGINQGLIDVRRQSSLSISQQTISQHSDAFRCYQSPTQAASRLVICLLAQSPPPELTSDQGADMALAIYHLAQGLAERGHYVHVTYPKHTKGHQVEYRQGIWLHGVDVQQTDTIKSLSSSEYSADTSWQQAMLLYREVKRIEAHHHRVDVIQIPTANYAIPPLLSDDYLKHKLVTRIAASAVMAETHYYEVAQSDMVVA